MHPNQNLNEYNFSAVSYTLCVKNVLIGHAIQYINIRLNNDLNIIILIHNINPLSFNKLLTLSEYIVLNAMLKYYTTYILYFMAFIVRT